MRLFLSDSGTSPSTIRLREALDYRRLAHAGLSDEHRVVLGTAREDLDHTADLVVTPDDRIELALPREFGEVAPVALERLVLLLGVLRGYAVAAADRLQGLEEVVAVDAETVRQCQEEVLDREVLVAHLGPRFVRALEGLRQLAAERRLGGAVGLRDLRERFRDLVADRERRRHRGGRGAGSRPRRPVTAQPTEDGRDRPRRCATAVASAMASRSASWVFSVQRFGSSAMRVFLVSC